MCVQINTIPIPMLSYCSRCEHSYLKVVKFGEYNVRKSMLQDFNSRKQRKVGREKAKEERKKELIGGGEKKLYKKG